MIAQVFKIDLKKSPVRTVVKHAQYIMLASKLGDSIVDATIRNDLKGYKIYPRNWQVDKTAEEIEKIVNDPMTMLAGESNINPNPAGTKKTVVTMYSIPKSMKSKSSILKDAYSLQYVQEITMHHNKPDVVIWEGWSTWNFHNRNMLKGFGSIPGYPSDADNNFPLPHQVYKAKRLREKKRKKQLANPTPRITIPTYVPQDNSSMPHGELDIYPEKEKLAEDTNTGLSRWVVTTYGKGDEVVTTDVTVDAQGDVKKVNSIVVSSNNDNNAIEIDGNDNNAKPTIRVKVAGNYREDFFYAYKAVQTTYGQMPAIAKLRIPSDSNIMVSKFETKARSNKALVEAIWEFELSHGAITYTDYHRSAVSCVYQNKSITYIVGEWVELDRIDEVGMVEMSDERDACAPGIHWCFSQEDALRFHFMPVDHITNADIFEDPEETIIPKGKEELY